MSTFKRYTGSAWVDPANVRRWTGSAWQDAGFVRRWTGSAWEGVWPIIALSNRTITGYSFGGTAVAGMIFETDGGAYEYRSDGGSTAITDEWGRPTASGLGNDFYVRARHVSGASAGLGLDLNTWYALTSQRNWLLSRSIDGTSNSTLDFDIGDSGFNVLATGRVTLYATRDSFTPP